MVSMSYTVTRFLTILGTHVRYHVSNPLGGSETSSYELHLYFTFLGILELFYARVSLLITPYFRKFLFMCLCASMDSFGCVNYYCCLISIYTYLDTLLFSECHM
jgi:hypothetical protein